MKHAGMARAYSPALIALSNNSLPELEQICELADTIPITAPSPCHQLAEPIASTLPDGYPIYPAYKSLTYTALGLWTARYVSLLSPYIRNIKFMQNIRN
jgi:hypothetical protein